MDRVRMLVYITGAVDQELLLRNEHLVAENWILKAQLKTSLRLTDADRNSSTGTCLSLQAPTLSQWKS